jgi:uncharacterized protein (DUF924 family)
VAAVIADDARGVHAFWFGELTDGFADPAHRKAWFAADPDRDALIRERFGSLTETAATGALDDWLGTPVGVLAFILVCDQFTRQIHRGTAAAFALDPLALGVARRGIEAGFDRQLGVDERAFFYLPFEHAESVVDQHTAVGLFTRLHEDAPLHQRDVSREFLRYVEQHRDIVLRFGRFPHRNRALGRASTPEELEFLATGPRFGQG